MKTIEEFKVFCENELKPELGPLEEKRIETKKAVDKAIVKMVIVYLVIFALALFLTGGKGNFQSIIFITFIYVAICAAIVQKIYSKYNMVFKNIVVRKIIGFFDKNLSYSEEGYMSQAEFEKSDLYRDRIDKYRGEDYVQGMIYDEEYERETGEKKGTEIEFSELHVIKVVTTHDSKGHTHRHDETVFRGLFFKCDFNKNFNSEVRVLPDMGILNFINFGQRIKLEDPEFENLFQVYGTDQIESRYILTPSLMKRITEYKNRTGRDVRLSFVDQHVYITISYSRGLFEANIYKSLYDFTEMQQYYEDLLAVIGIVEELNLNNKIWSKE